MTITDDVLSIITTSGVALFECGTLFNTNTDKLAIVDDNLQRWRAAVETWQHESDWTVNKTLSSDYYHPLPNAIRRSVETSEFFSRLLGAQSAQDLFRSLDAFIQVFGRSPAGGTANRWLVANLAARGLALGPGAPAHWVSWLPKTVLIDSIHPWAGLKPRNNIYFRRAKFLLNATKLPVNGQISASFLNALFNHGMEWDSGLKSSVLSLLREICDEARSRDGDWVNPDIYHGRVWGGRKRTLSDPNAWYITDPNYGDPSFTIWRDDAADWLSKQTHARLSRQAAALTRLMKWNKSLSVPLLAPIDLRRFHVKRSHDTPENFTTFLEYWESSDISARSKSDDIVMLHAFFEWWHDNRGLDLGLDPNRGNPFKETDLTQHSTLGRASKSNKRVLPREVLLVAKEINRENNYAFARSLHQCQARVFDPDIGAWEERFGPVLPTAIDIMLTLPIRTIQTMLLDSGEVDEKAYDPISKTFVQNDHHLTQSGRRQGVLREIHTTLGPPVLGFFINTNKTELRGDGQAERGYEIPWREPYLIGRIAELAAWQRKFNPVRTLDDLKSRDQLRSQKSRHEGKVHGLTRHAFLGFAIKRS